jgi:outer membrane receptor protein involved in Fe transport
MKTRILTAAVSLATLANTSALAQSTQLEEVIVTASKRVESMQDVGIAISALGTDALEAKGIVDFESYARLLPGLSYVDAGVGKRKLIVRGLSSGTDFGGEQATVTVYFDDIPLTSSVGFPDLHMFDIERLELLRGPQGTLYGTGSMGGTLKIITNKPTTEGFEAKIDASYGTIDGGDTSHAINGMINVPVTENFALRAVAYEKVDGGYIDYTHPLVDRNDVNEVQTTGGRLAMLWTPTDRLRIRGSVIHQKSDIAGKSWFEPETGDLQISAPVVDTQDDITDIYNLTVEYDFDNFTALSTTSLFEGNNDWMFEFSENAYLVLQPLFDAFGVEPISPHHYDEDYKIFSQEIRLQSQSDGPWQWTAGVYYEESDVRLRQTVVVDQLPLLALGLGVAFGNPNFNPGAVMPGGVYYVGDNVTYANDGTTEVEQMALFGEVSYDFNEQWTAVFGGRWYDIEGENAGYAIGLQNSVVDPSVPPPGYREFTSADASQDGFNPKVALEYRPNDDTMLYLLASQGYRLGGTNSDIVTLYGAPSEYDSDDLWNYEFGFKLDLFDRRARLNGALYYLDWTGIQTKQLLANGFGYTDNAGEASVYGLELEGSYILNENWSVDFTLDTKQAELEEDFITEGSMQGEAGDQLQAVPELTYSLTLNNYVPMGDDMELQSLLSVQYVGESSMEYDFVATKDDDIGDYTMVNARVSMVMDNGFTIALYGENLTDERGVTSASNLVNLRQFVVRPRSFGINLRYAFD